MKKFNPAALPYLAALAQFVQFAHAGFILGGWVVAVIGGIIGAVVSFSVAYTGSRVASVNGQKREKWVNAGTLFVLMLSPLAIIAPVHYSFGVLENDVWRWITAGAWVLSPDVAILLDGLVTGKKLVASEDRPAQRTTPKKIAPSKEVQETPKKYERKCKYCDEILSSPQAIGGHMKKHHPDKCAKKVYELPVEMRKI